MGRLLLIRFEIIKFNFESGKFCGNIVFSQVWERTVQAFELEGVQIGGADGKSKSDESIEEQTEKIPPKPSVSFEDLFSKESQ